MKYSNRYKYQVESFKRISRVFKKEVQLIEKYFDIQQELFDNHFPAIDHDNELHWDKNKLLCQAFIKAQNLIYSSSILVRQGQHGTARVLLRQILEFLILAKYVAITDNDLLSKKWPRGDFVHLTNDIINKIKKPPITELRTIHKAFHEFTHASPKSSQIDFNRKLLVVDIHHDLMWILILQTLNYHLLGSHIITDRMKFLIDYWTNKRDENVELRLKAKEIRTQISRMLKKDGRKFIREYTFQWKV